MTEMWERINMLPKEVDACFLCIYRCFEDSDMWIVEYTEHYLHYDALINFKDRNLPDALEKMIVRCIENNYLSLNKSIDG